MRRLPLLFLLPCILAAGDRWIKFTAGPFEVLTDAGQDGRETLVRFEEFRHAVGEVVGETDLQTPQPVRILLFKNGRGWTATESIMQGRDCYAIVLEEKAPVSPAVWIGLTRLFLAVNTAQMPPAFEHGLVEFFSTFSVNGIHITVGTPPPQPDLDWARIHLLVTVPEYFGSLKRAALQPAPGRGRRSRLPQRLRQIRRRNRGAGAAAFRRPAIFRPRHDFQPAHGPEAISPRGPSPTPTPGWRAPTCWPAIHRPPSTRSCSART